ncbi:MAG: iron ABC transporter permease [Thermoprotei archaeon]|nr:MAG: iron ABC transporter permease [Thermoprotei archaeon]RLE89684.1 MAG: iron ABC transporter permease [Thermoprotei archaeon]
MFYLDPVLVTQLAFPTLMLTLFLIAPIATVLLVSLNYNPADIFTDPTYVNFNPRGSPITIRLITFRGREFILIKISGVSLGIIMNSLVNSFIVTICASILGIVVAFVMARYSFPGRTILRVLAMTPLLVTPFINAFVIRKIFDWRDGIISWIIGDVLHLPYRIGIEDLAGVAITQIMTFFPIIYLNVYSSMINIDPSMEEQAENLGAKGLKLFRTVTLPLSLPGLAAGAAIVFIFSLEDVAAPIVFNEKRFMSYHILERFLEATTGQLSPVAATLSLILLILALAAFIGIKKYVTLKQYAMLSRGGRWSPRIRRLRLKGLIVVYLFILPLLLFAAFPQIGVFIYALAENWADPLPYGFTLEHMAKIVEDPLVFRAIVNSLTYSILAIILIVAIGVSSSYVIARARIPATDLLDILVTSPIALPGLVIAVGYFYFFTSIFRGTPLDPITFGPALLLSLAYSVRRLPFTARAVYAGLQQVHIALEEASLNLGASRLKTLVSIVIPLIGINILSGALISFVYCMSETSVGITLGGLKGVGEEHQAPISFIMMDYLERVGGPHIVASLGVLLISIQLLVIVLVNVVFKQKYAYIGV